MNGISNILNVASGLSVLQSATQGINRGMEGLARDTQAIASANVAPTSIEDVTGAMVDSIQQKLAVELNARMLQVGSETLGTVLNVKA